MALERLKTCDNVSSLAAELGVHRTLLYHWQNQMAPEEGLEPNSRVRGLRKEVRDLKHALAEKVLEVDFFKGALQKIEARRRGSGSGGTASTTKSGK